MFWQLLELELGVVAQRGRDVEVVGGAHGQRQLAEGVLQFDDSLAEDGANLLGQGFEIQAHTLALSGQWCFRGGS